MMSIIHNLFVQNSWSIAWRQLDDDSRNVFPIGTAKVRYTAYKESEHCYFADPFIIENENGVYLFVESMNRYRGKGTISVSKMENNGHFAVFSQVLCEPFHLSFPNVFAYKGTYYMIPETNEVKQIRLYKATHFPIKWELERILIDDGNEYVDTSLLLSENKAIMFCYYTDKSTGAAVNRRFRLDFENWKVTELQTEGYNIDRPAGNCFYSNQTLYRPMQNCHDYYGQGVYIYKIQDDRETLCGEIKPENLVLQASHRHLSGTHTFNRSQNYEVTDFRYDRFCFTKPWMKIVRRLLRVIRFT